MSAPNAMDIGVLNYGVETCYLDVTVHNAELRGLFFEIYQKKNAFVKFFREKG
jgi:hypothetical protein